MSVIAARLGISSGTVTRLKKHGSVMFFKGCTSLLVPEQTRGRTTRLWWGEDGGNKNNTQVGVGAEGAPAAGGRRRLLSRCPIGSLGGLPDVRRPLGHLGELSLAAVHPDQPQEITDDRPKAVELDVRLQRQRFERPLAHGPLIRVEREWVYFLLPEFVDVQEEEFRRRAEVESLDVGREDLQFLGFEEWPQPFRDLRGFHDDRREHSREFLIGRFIRTVHNVLLKVREQVGVKLTLFYNCIDIKSSKCCYA